MKHRLNTSFFTLLLILSYSHLVHGLTINQEKEIRLSKASILFSQEREKQALKLLKRNMEGEFHVETYTMLARHFYKKKVFTKSFRFYQVLIKKGIGRRVVKAHFNHQLKENFIELLAKIKKPSIESLSLTHELAQRFYTTYKDKTLPEEFLQSVLSLSEKYYSVTDYFNYFKGESKLNLARISLIRDDIDDALLKLHAAQRLFINDQKENHFKEDTLLEDIKVLLAEAYIKKGKGDVGLLLMRSLSAQKDIDPTIKTYAKNYLKALNNSFVNAIFSYGFSSKKNINQLSQNDYDSFESLNNANSLGKKDDVFHTRRLNVFMNRQLNDQYNLSGSLDFINESAFSNQVDEPNFTNTEFAINLKRFRDNSSIIHFDYKFNNLSGRELNSLQFIQPQFSHRFSVAYQWLYRKGLIKFEAPLKLSTYRNERSTNSFSLSMSYESLITGRWIAPKYYSLLGRRSEGENFGSSLYFQLGATNKSDITDNWNLITSLDYYSNQNTEDLLNYSEFNLSLMINHRLKILKGLSAGFKYLMTTRSFNESLGTINMSEIGLALTYNF